MNSQAVTITAHGVLDHTRAETLAARLRAAVRNGKTAITLNFETGTVLASPNLLAFVLRATEVVRGRGGQLSVTGDGTMLQQLQALGLPTAGTTSAANQGVGS